ncbi:MULTISPECIES: ABC transporter substrate-binding protein [Acidiphilium]|uniref:Carbohydrate ABC transporter substrate-binding protein, CUT1 family n=2 Tax=Acidiphilium TaxID=522 RepID=A5G1M5_ACICJ|nr:MULTISPECIES: extracellular solute-binding protein [Acidiphilium]MBU6357014.1 extracellular solute-binding protein [Rhodospirillales bacterium]ABQ31757.1 carbohydrate ABC transporter substrate-binding protein, CUT1 family [Acidiphilium cryptum JF-5]KDM67222.1 extracellular solute-binding protein [Acidiphilium sp. JA12-A1]MBS3023039.1 extracellular solute-binding protein [Acidiphilium multivorum]BAJ82238.1 putative ABC transporter substrate-binding protein [Acidiphilium multivorum AIU301]
MTDKIKDLAADFVNGNISRRDFARRAGALGVGAAAVNFALGGAVTQAMAADFNWQAHKGKKLRLLLNKHPYADAMIADLAHFKAMTGIDVEYDIFPEDVYFDKVTAALSSHSNRYDVLMTGAYQTWQYGPARWLVDMNEYLKDSSKTAPNYDFNGIIENLRKSDAWSGKPGEALGSKNAKQWAIPLGFELYNISYNKRIFDKLKLEPPKNLPDMIEIGTKITKDAGGAYGVSVRGSRSWATIHPGYLSAYTNYGAKDFDVSAKGMKSVVNSAQSKEMNKLWVEMIQKCGPKNWATYTWYEVAQDLGAGRCGMIYDANIIGFFENGPGNKESGHIGYAPFVPNPKMDHSTSNVWIWSLAMSSFSHQKDAAWYFIQWASGKNFGIFGGVKKQLVDPVRETTWKDPAFKARLDKNYPGFYSAFEKSLPDAKIYFTPQPLFFNVTTEWAAALQRMVAKEVSVDEGLDKLAAHIDHEMKSAGI